MKFKLDSVELKENIGKSTDGKASTLRQLSHRARTYQSLSVFYILKPLNLIKS